MTKKQALERAIAVLSINDEETVTVDVLNAMLDKLEKGRTPMSEEKKAELSAKRKQATAEARQAEGAVVIPVLTKYLDKAVTAKELFELAKDELPAGFSWNKVQNYLIRELAPMVTKVEAKGKPNTYQLIG